MKYIVRLLAFLLVFSSLSFADFIPCLDTLASAQYGSELKNVPLEVGISGFAKKEFGDFFPVAKKELDRGRKYIKSNFLWSDTHSYSDKDIPFITEQAKRWQILCSAYKDRAKIEVAPFTEHNLSNPDKYNDIVKRNAPDCEVINSVYKGALSKKYKNEIHGNHTKPAGRYNYSYDGTNSVDSDVTTDKKKFFDAEVFCMWNPRLNLRWSMGDSTSRQQRIKEANQRSPSKDMLLSLAYLFTERGNVSLPKGWLVKSHSEKHDAADQKGDKLLVISPVRSNTIELKKNGKPAGTLSYYGSYQAGGFRYYGSQFGYKYGKDLDVFIGSKKYGVMNGGFRQGNYR